jgi:hypothetical protein
MKKSIAATLRLASPLCVKSVLLKACSCIVLLCSAGCTTTHVQWDAVQMREQVVDYYNDEIMDNLIRALNGQPFVHVDVSGLQAVTTSKLAGSAGAGEVQTHTTGTSPTATAAGIVSTFSRAVTRPFTFSVNPERGENLTINSVPVIGAVSPSRDGKPNIYDLYLKFLNLKGSNKADFSYLTSGCSSLQRTCALKERLSLRSEQCVPGTIKERGGCLYYVPIAYQTQYLELFQAILTAQRPGGAPSSGQPVAPVPTFTL